MEEALPLAALQAEGRIALMIRIAVPFAVWVNPTAFPDSRDESGSMLRHALPAKRMSSLPANRSPFIHIRLYAWIAVTG